ncbi:MAG: hypothetical protein ACLSE7_13470 [Lachnospirales bacterium]
MSGPYDDIINLPHPTSQRHPRMPIHDRAAIFSPFAALSGHGAAIAETARLTERDRAGRGHRAELDRGRRFCWNTWTSTRVTIPGSSRMSEKTAGPT